MKILFDEINNSYRSLLAIKAGKDHNNGGHRNDQPITQIDMCQ